MIAIVRATRFPRNDNWNFLRSISAKAIFIISLILIPRPCCVTQYHVHLDDNDLRRFSGTIKPVCIYMHAIHVDTRISIHKNENYFYFIRFTCTHGVLQNYRISFSLKNFQFIKLRQEISNICNFSIINRLSIKKFRRIFSFSLIFSSFLFL